VWCCRWRCGGVYDVVLEKQAGELYLSKSQEASGTWSRPLALD
jgi:hypothetical protein